MCEVVSKNIAFLKKHTMFSPKKTLFSQQNHCFPEKPIVFQHVHFFIPLFWNEKLSLNGRNYKN